MKVTRRAILGAAPGLLAGCGAKRIATAPRQAPRLSRVIVAKDRVIRTIVGLRPFRPSGFVVRAKKIDAKTVVHNYGHGGAGITLSWGTSAPRGGGRHESPGARVRRDRMRRGRPLHSAA